MVATNLRRPEIPGITLRLGYRWEREPSSYQSKGNRPAVTAIWEGGKACGWDDSGADAHTFTPSTAVEDPASLASRTTKPAIGVSSAAARQSVSARTTGVREMARNFLLVAAVVLNMWGWVTFVIWTE
jgi:hypothetical protein